MTSDGENSPSRLAFVDDTEVNEFGRGFPFASLPNLNYPIPHNSFSPLGWSGDDFLSHDDIPASTMLVSPSHGNGNMASSPSDGETSTSACWPGGPGSISSLADSDQRAPNQDDTAQMEESPVNLRPNPWPTDEGLLQPTSPSLLLISAPSPTGTDGRESQSTRAIFPSNTSVSSSDRRDFATQGRSQPDAAAMDAGHANRSQPWSSRSGSRITLIAKSWDGSLQLFYLNEIAKDGNCQWRCFARSLEGTSGDDARELLTVQRLRDFAAKCVELNRYEISNSMTIAAVSATIQEFRTMGSHGNEHSLMLSSHCLQRPVWVWTRKHSNSTGLVPYRHECYNAQYHRNNAIHLLYDYDASDRDEQRSGHYSLLEPVSDGEAAASSSSTPAQAIQSEPHLATSSCSPEVGQSVSSNNKKRTILATSSGKIDAPDQLIASDELTRPSKRPKPEASNQPDEEASSSASASVSTVPPEEITWAFNSPKRLPDCVTMLERFQQLEQLVTTFGTHGLFVIIHDCQEYLCKLNRQTRAIDVLRQRAIYLLSCRTLAAITLNDTPPKNCGLISKMGHILPIEPTQTIDYQRVASRRVQSVWSGKNPLSGYTFELVCTIRVGNEAFQVLGRLLTDTQSNTLFHRRNQGSYAFQLVVDGSAAGLPMQTEVFVRINFDCRSNTSVSAARCAERTNQQQKKKDPQTQKVIRTHQYGFCTVLGRLDDTEPYHLEVALESSLPRLVSLVDVNVRFRKGESKKTDPAGDQVSLVCEPTHFDVAEGFRSTELQHSNARDLKHRNKDAAKHLS